MNKMAADIKTVLTQVIGKAITNGWLKDTDGVRVDEPFTQNLGFGYEHGVRAIWTKDAKCIAHNIDPYRLIFDHGFAKALWGESNYLINTYSVKVVLSEDFPVWKHHLMLMVIAEDPIQYLRQHIEDGPPEGKVLS